MVAEVILFLLVLGLGLAIPVSVICLIVKKLRGHFLKSLIGTCILFVLCIVCAGFLDTDASKTDSKIENTTSIEKDESVTVTKESEDVQVTSVSTSNSDDLSTDLATLFDKSISGTYTNLKITPDYTENNYTVQYQTTESVWDETDLVKMCISDYINFCIETYKYDDVDGIKFAIFGTMMDSKGNENINNIMTIKMMKDQFNTFNWTNLEYREIYDTFVSNCESYWLEVGIEKYIDKSEIIYVP